jgi:hypothetical protein
MFQRRSLPFMKACRCPSTTACGAGGLPFRLWPKRQKDTGCSVVELATGRGAPGLKGKNQIHLNVKLKLGQRFAA